MESVIPYGAVVLAEESEHQSFVGIYYLESCEEYRKQDYTYDSCSHHQNRAGSCGKDKQQYAGDGSCDIDN